jgi:hypothetical protein
MTYFADLTFDNFFADFTQINQTKPSPLDIPAFEIVDRNHPSFFFVDYNAFQAVTLSDSTGVCFSAYHKINDGAVHVKHLARTFPCLDGEDTYFDQCSSTFDRTKLPTFRDTMDTKLAGNLCRATESFQTNTVCKWKTNADEPTKSVFIGLVGINESASKECDAITLDLLLRAGVLVEQDDGR